MPWTYITQNLRSQVWSTAKYLILPTLADVRRDMAGNYLSNSTDLTMHEAYVLGYGNPTVLTGANHAVSLPVVWWVFLPTRSPEQEINEFRAKGKCAPAWDGRSEEWIDLVNACKQVA